MPSYRLIPDSENRDTLTRRRWFSFGALQGTGMEIRYGKKTHLTLIGIAVVGAVYLAFKAFLFAQKLESGDATVNVTLVISSVLLWGAFLLFTTLFTDWRVTKLRHQQMWLMDAVNWNIEQLKAHGFHGMPNREIATNLANEHRWPWGNHHTESLGHLEAAARKWWVLYDPGDLTTAPTNEMVSDWLQSERGISREKARAIASMLRPDGLPTGPRK